MKRPYYQFVPRCIDRCKIFLYKCSGKQLVPASEESLEESLEEAIQALDEWNIPDAHQKQRFTASLGGSTSEAILNLKLSKLDCTDHLSILQDMLGLTVKAYNLMYQFEHTTKMGGRSVLNKLGQDNASDIAKEKVRSRRNRF